RVAAMDVDDPKTKERIISTGEDIDRDTAKLIAAAAVKRMRIRSPLSCHAKHGICRACYGRSMATGKLVESGEAVGILAAHVTAGEALAKPERRTKGKIDMPSPVSGTVHVMGGGQITIAMQEVEERVYEVAHQARLRIDNGQQVSAGDFLSEGSANPQDI